MDASIENARLRARLARVIDPADAAIDVVITANEINDLHGTGVLLKRILDGERLFSIRSRNDWGAQDFGRWSARIAQAQASRAETFRNVLRVLAGRAIRNAICVPYLADEVATAIAIREMFGARLCGYIMDDQNISTGAIPDAAMREFLEKCSLRLATHPELRRAYERKYGLKFFLLPGVAPDALIARHETAAVGESGRAVMVGNVWHQKWLDDLCASLDGARRIDWFGNNRFWPVDFEEAKLARAGIVARGLISETGLARELKNYPFAMVPVAGGDQGELALSLPGRIIFGAAVAQTPVLVIGSEASCAAKFVRRFGIGTVAPYDRRRIAQAMEFLLDPATQTEMRRRAAAMGPAFSDRGVKQWLRESMELGRAADDRFEKAFAG